MLLHNSFIEVFRGSQNPKSKEIAIAKEAFEFLIQFMRKGGFLFLSDIFKDIEKDGLENSMLRQKTLTLLIEIIY